MLFAQHLPTVASPKSIPNLRFHIMSCSKDVKRMCVVVVPPLKIPWADDKEIEDLLSDVNVDVEEEATSHCTMWSPVLM